MCTQNNGCNMKISSKYDQSDIEPFFFFKIIFIVESITDAPFLPLLPSPRYPL